MKKITDYTLPIIHFVTLMVIMATSSEVKNKNYVEIPDLTGLNGTTYIVSAFSPKSFIRSAEFNLNSTQCVQYTFKLLERRVRLHAFTCHLGSGGFCTLDKFSFPEDREGCTYLRPWTTKIETWSFYFVLEKRPRKYGKAYAARQKLKVKRQTSTKKETSTAPFGVLELYGVVPCSEACGNQDKPSLGSKADGTFHRGRSNRLLY